MHERIDLRAIYETRSKFACEVQRKKKASMKFNFTRYNLIYVYIYIFLFLFLLNQQMRNSYMTRNNYTPLAKHRRNSNTNG